MTGVRYVQTQRIDDVAIQEVSLASLGLVTVQEASSRLKCTPKAVQNWINAGLLPAAVVSSGSKRTFLIREKDLKSFKRPPRGRPRSQV